MKEEYRKLIKYEYEHSRGDSKNLFKTILSIAQDTGLAKALNHLEQCVIEKRSAWLDRIEPGIQKTGNPLLDGFNIFYERYLGLSIPQDGEIIEATEKRIVFRWWNKCPTLEACVACGLDTRVVCKMVYHQPVQIMLSRIDPRLRFERNYNSLRPYTEYCEECIEIDQSLNPGKLKSQADLETLRGDKNERF